MHRYRPPAVHGEEGRRDRGGRAGTSGRAGNPRRTDRDEEELLLPRQRATQREKVEFHRREFSHK